jgi:hypothetical protein
MITVVAAVTVGVAAVVLGVLLAQPSRAWQDAAEHRRAFWIAWALAAGAVAAAGPPLLGPGVAGAAWLAGFAAVGVLQPALLADLADVRSLVRRRRRVSARPVPTADPRLRPIRWRAPAVSEHRVPAQQLPIGA